MYKIRNKGLLVNDRERERERQCFHCLKNRGKREQECISGTLMWQYKSPQADTDILQGRQLFIVSSLTRETLKKIDQIVVRLLILLQCCNTRESNQHIVIYQVVIKLKLIKSLVTHIIANWSNWPPDERLATWSNTHFSKYQFAFTIKVPTRFSHLYFSLYQVNFF